MAKNSYRIPFVSAAVLLLLLTVCPFALGADEIISSLNGKLLEPSGGPQEYSLFPAGYIYGAPGSSSAFYF